MIFSINLILLIHMKFNRRDTIRQLALGAGAAFSGALFPHSAFASVSGSAPKRVIFFLQNQGFEPGTCIPDGMKNSGSLSKVKLPEPIEALEPFKERLHIINGLHGLHTSPGA